MLPQFDTSTFKPQVFWVFITFGIFYFIVKRYIAPPLNKVLLMRSDIIATDLNKAEILSKEIVALKASYEVELAKIHQEASSLRESTIETFHNLYEEKRRKIFKELEELKVAALDEIKEDIKKFKIKQTEPLLNLASFIIHKLINKQPNKEILKKAHLRG